MPVRLLQHGLDVSALQLGEGYGRRRRAVGARRARPGIGEWEVARVVHPAVRQQHGALDDVAQLGYVAWPAIPLKRFHGFVGEPRRRRSTVLMKEVLGP